MTQQETLSKNWSQLKPKVRPQWISLSDADVNMIEGSYDVLVELLREKYGYPESQAQSQIETFLEENVSAPAKA